MWPKRLWTEGFRPLISEGGKGKDKRKYFARIGRHVGRSRNSASDIFKGGGKLPLGVGNGSVYLGTDCV